MFYRSDRLFLRPAWPEDWQELFALIRDEEIVRNLANAPWPYSAEDAQSTVDKSQEFGVPHFMLTIPSANGVKLIGSAGLRRCGSEIELTYWIARDYWGQGYATEAAQAVLEVARGLGHRRIAAGHFHDNPASQRVLVKAGFCPTGERLRRYSLGRGGNVTSVRYGVELNQSDNSAAGEDDSRPLMAA